MFTVRSHKHEGPIGPKGANRHLDRLAEDDAQAFFDGGNPPFGSPVMTGRYVRAARALLGWTQADLATHAKIGIRTVKRFENDEETTPVVATAIERAFEDAGLRIFRDAGELAKVKELGVAIVMPATT